MTTTEKSETRKMLTFSDLKKLELPPRKYIIAPWLKEGESAMVYAPTGVGKSMFAMTLALAVAGVGDVFGWSCPEPKKVLYVDGEMHIADLQERAVLLSKTIEGNPSSGIMGELLSIYARQYQDSSVFLDLATSEGQEELLNVLDEEGPVDLLILDNLSTLATIADENAASSFDPILKLLMELKRRGVATILVHHAGKSRTRNDFRGSSKLATTFEVIMGLKPMDESAKQTAWGTGFAIQWDKFRQKPDERVALMDVRLDTSDPDHPRWLFAEAEDADLMKLVAAVKSCEYGTDDDIRVKLFPHLKNKSQMSRLKQRAIETKLIDRAHWGACMKEAREAFVEPSDPNVDF